MLINVRLPADETMWVKRVMTYNFVTHNCTHEHYCIVITLQYVCTICLALQTFAYSVFISISSYADIF